MTQDLTREELEILERVLRKLTVSEPERGDVPEKIVGRRYRVCGDSGWVSVGDILTLIEDDGTTRPRFECSDGKKYYLPMGVLELLPEDEPEWEPKEGEWVWCGSCEIPVRAKEPFCKLENEWVESYGEHWPLKPLEGHLPVLEYEGFKVGDTVYPTKDWMGWEFAGKECVIEEFCFETELETPIQVKSDDGYYGRFELSELSKTAPEPERYMTHPDDDTMAGTVVSMKPTVPDCIELYNDDFEEDAIIVHVSEIRQLIDILEKCEVRLKSKGGK